MPASSTATQLVNPASYSERQARTSPCRVHSHVSLSYQHVYMSCVDCFQSAKLDSAAQKSTPGECKPQSTSGGVSSEGKGAFSCTGTWYWLPFIRGTSNFSQGTRWKSVATQMFKTRFDIHKKTRACIRGMRQMWIENLAKSDNQLSFCVDGWHDVVKITGGKTCIQVLIVQSPILVTEGCMLWYQLHANHRAHYQQRMQNVLICVP